MTEIKDNVNDKPLVRFNEKGFVLNYSVTRNEEIAFIDYENNKKDHETYLTREKEDENNKSEDSK